MSDIKRDGPATNGAAPTNPASESHYTGPLPVSPDLWAALGNGYAVVVHMRGGRYRRRLYFSLASAQRQAARARARGEHTHLALVRLVPCAEVTP